MELDGKSVDEASHSTKGRLSGAPAKSPIQFFPGLARLKVVP